MYLWVCICECKYIYMYEAETPVLWPPHAKSWKRLIGKDSDAGRDWGQEKGTTEDELAGWHHWLDGHESEWTPGVGDGQRCLVCCDSWGRKESDMTERLNWTERLTLTFFHTVGTWIPHMEAVSVTAISTFLCVHNYHVFYLLHLYLSVLTLIARDHTYTQYSF